MRLLLALLLIVAACTGTAGDPIQIWLDDVALDTAKIGCQ
jgi:hypothetical protein